MKKLLFVFLIILLIPFSVSAKAQESNGYYRVIDDETPFFSDVKGENLMFYLPYTYYVKVLGISGNIAHIECFGSGDTVKIDGYTYFDNLFFDGLNVLDPYLEQKVMTQKTAVLYSNPNLSDPIQFVFAERKLNYYGHLNIDDEYVYCVEYGGIIGYLKESDLYPFYIEDHPNEQTFLPSSPTPPPSENGSDTDATTPFRIIIISCLVLAGIIGLFIAVKKKKSPIKTGDFYEESDYE